MFDFLKSWKIAIALGIAMGLAFLVLNDLLFVAGGMVSAAMGPEERNLVIMAGEVLLFVTQLIIFFVLYYHVGYMATKKSKLSVKDAALRVAGVYVVVSVFMLAAQLVHGFMMAPLNAMVSENQEAAIEATGRALGVVLCFYSIWFAIGIPVNLAVGYGASKMAGGK